MKHIFTILLIGLSMGLQSQSTVVFSKVTASWCPNCGTWGWGFMENMKAQYANDEKAIVLGVHYSGDLETPTAKWFANNLNSVGQPQFYVNNERVSVGSSSWQAKAEEVKETIDNFSADSYSEFKFDNAFINANGMIEANITFNPISEAPTNDLYFGLYIFENNVSNFQAGLGTVAEHPNVLRRAVSNAPEGEIFASAGSTDITLDATANFTAEVQGNWVKEELGLLAIVWEQTPTGFVINYAQAVENLGLLSSDENILDEANFNIVNNVSNLNVRSLDNVDYNFTLLDAQGKAVYQDVLNQELTVSTNNLSAGIYIVNIQKNDKYFSQKVFIK